METRKEIAAEKKRCGSHNCTQAVVCTYHDYTGMDEETLKNVGNAFAAGMENCCRTRLKLLSYDIKGKKYGAHHNLVQYTYSVYQMPSIFRIHP